MIPGSAVLSRASVWNRMVQSPCDAINDMHDIVVFVLTCRDAPRIRLAAFAALPSGAAHGCDICESPGVGRTRASPHAAPPHRGHGLPGEPLPPLEAEGGWAALRTGSWHVAGACARETPGVTFRGRGFV